ncbi:GNAT family N-acetyltransferase [Robertmurraya kyonggiensis]|uniref:GNAT family N-acetyltransferase n=1 Tax=Robertmurraya kyonggiensis TaxID=1037680 RepID=A0A4U1DBQ9_9BACI|nr:GNAT family N-acetyltransferase [Robertmurraya kyonggiensis]TKC19057.1 GNAT family N-acetyltransferase [Robertmurraya kyonggiensis]
MFYETERLYTRRFKLSDLEDFHEMQSNPNVMRFIIGRGKTKTENADELSKVIKAYDDNYSELLIMAISKIGDASLIGTCAVIKTEKDECEVGYRFSERHWGKGYGSDILKGLLQYCLHDLELMKANAIVEKDNIPSVKILENSPMQFIREYEEEDTNNIVRLYALDKLV